ncbi:hypothetical protein V5O48_009765 [Marasmius crinis-equi]|uniref:Uncharacterized protein n=1 Tax=Marasmius crinis-equi TaxID=585013 RepID=A0ABR3FAA3_9AGAR
MAVDMKFSTSLSIASRNSKHMCCTRAVGHRSTPWRDRFRRPSRAGLEMASKEDLRGARHWMEAQGVTAEDDEQQVIKYQGLQIPSKSTPSIRSVASAGRTSRFKVIADNRNSILGEVGAYPGGWASRVGKSEKLTGRGRMNVSSGAASNEKAEERITITGTQHALTQETWKSEVVGLGRNTKVDDSTQVLPVIRDTISQLRLSMSFQHPLQSLVRPPHPPDTEHNPDTAGGILNEVGTYPTSLGPAVDSAANEGAWGTIRDKICGVYQYHNSDEWGETIPTNGVIQVAMELKATSTPTTTDLLSERKMATSMRSKLATNTEIDRTT